MTKILINILLMTIATVAISSCAKRAERQYSDEAFVATHDYPMPRRWVPGEVIVKFKGSPPAPGGAGSASPTGPTSPGDSPVAGPGPGTVVDPNLGSLAVTIVNPVINFETRRPMSGGALVLKFTPDQIPPQSEDEMEPDPTLRMVSIIRKQDKVEYAQANFIFDGSDVPNDPRYPQQWHFRDNGTGPEQSPGGINLPTAWDTQLGNSSVVVAVIDSGILPEHEDIADSPNLDNGWDMITDVFSANDNSPRDNEPTDTGDGVDLGDCTHDPDYYAPNSWHGTHVAGVVGVVATDNGIGVAGVARNVKVLPIRVLGRCGATADDIIDAIRWAAGLPVPGATTRTGAVDVINMSLRLIDPCEESTAMQIAIDEAVQANVTIVVAAGNEHQPADNVTPASCNNVITVAASDMEGNMMGYSNFGSKVDIMAPGGDLSGWDPSAGVLSPVKDGYEFKWGTSMAAPHVSGVAALMLSLSPNMTPQEVETHLKETALSRTPAQCPNPCGTGLLDAAAAVNVAANIVPITSPQQPEPPGELGTEPPAEP